MTHIKVGILGFGTIGTGVAKSLLHNQELLRARTGITFELAKIADLDITTPRGIDLDPSLLTTDAYEILNDPEIQIVVELIGGYEPAKTFLLHAIAQGKHVVTANKALLAVHGQEIFTAASQQQVDVGFEASVGGGIPIIRSLREGLVVNNFTEIYGILNGTTNYILTEMTDKGQQFAPVLQQAQDLGYAEADPTFDIDGIDATHKLAILAYLAFGLQVPMDAIFTEGIRDIEAIDIKYARELGYKVKLVAITKQIDKAVEVRVHPTMLPEDHLLAKVDGSFNAVYVVGDIVDATMFYGRGAGMMPTASAVVGDIVDIGGNIDKGISQKLPLLASPDLSSQLALQARDQFRSRYYLRFTAVDRHGVLSKISGVLAEHQISIASVIQKERHWPEGQGQESSVPIVMLTEEATERDMQQAIDKLNHLDVITDQTVLIRVL